MKNSIFKSLRINKYIIWYRKTKINYLIIDDLCFQPDFKTKLIIC